MGGLQNSFTGIDFTSIRPNPRVPPDLERIAQEDKDEDVLLAAQWAIKQVRRRV